MEVVRVSHVIDSLVKRMLERVQNELVVLLLTTNGANLDDDIA